MIGTTIGIDLENQVGRIRSIHLLVSNKNYITGYKDALQALGRARKAIEEKTFVFIYENNEKSEKKKY